MLSYHVIVLVGPCLSRVDLDLATPREPSRIRLRATRSSRGRARGSFTPRREGMQLGENEDTKEGMTSSWRVAAPA